MDEPWLAGREDEVQVVRPILPGWGERRAGLASIGK